MSSLLFLSLHHSPSFSISLFFLSQILSILPSFSSSPLSCSHTLTFILNSLHPFCPSSSLLLCLNLSLLFIFYFCFCSLFSLPPLFSPPNLVFLHFPFPMFSPSFIITTIPSSLYHSNHLSLPLSLHPPPFPTLSPAIITGVSLSLHCCMDRALSFVLH